MEYWWNGVFQNVCTFLSDYFVMHQRRPYSSHSQPLQPQISHFTFMWQCIETNWLKIKPTKCTNFSNLFWNETLHVLDSSSVHHQELFTVHSTNYICHTGSFRAAGSGWKLQFHPDPARELSTNLYDIHHCWWWTEELSKTCKISFQNKFEKFVHLVGFIIRKLKYRIYYSTIKIVFPKISTWNKGGGARN
jgi:hypothetical protein